MTRSTNSLAKHEGARPGGLCDVRPFRIITDYILTEFHIYVYIYLVTAGSFRICTRESFTHETCVSPSYLCLASSV